MHAGQPPERGDPLRVVLDANIVAAALIRPDGWTAQELARSDVEWCAPAFLVDELDEHASDYATKAGCTTALWNRRVAKLLHRIRLVPAADIAAAANDPRVRRIEAVDPDDAPYIAALVAIGADLMWTRDSKLLDLMPGIAVSIVPRAT